MLRLIRNSYVNRLIPIPAFYCELINIIHKKSLVSFKIKFKPGDWNILRTAAYKTVKAGFLEE